MLTLNPCVALGTCRSSAIDTIMMTMAHTFCAAMELMVYLNAGSQVALACMRGGG